MRPVVAVDWGTSTLRVARLDAKGAALDERSLPQGILQVPPGGFPRVLGDACGDWLKGDALVLISGMAGSRQGWVEAPYCECPAGLADIAARLAWVEPGRIAIVPGLSCAVQGVPDVMRGEETQVLGALDLLGLESATLVLPGTHSKWVRAASGRIESFSTFMTGEFYALLRRHSILARTMPDADGELDEPAFRRGVEHAMRSGSLLNAAFSARTLSLFERLPAKEGPSYLSGLVIGEEMRASACHAGLDPASIVAGQARNDKVVVIGSDELCRRYAIALQAVGLSSLPIGSQASWRGLHAIAQRLEGIA